MRFLKIINLIGEVESFDRGRVLGIYPLKDQFIISLPGYKIAVNQEQYDLDQILWCLDDYDVETVPMKDLPTKESLKEESLPEAITRWDFTYGKHCHSEDLWDWIEEDGDCYYMDGDPLKVEGHKISKDMALYLWEYYLVESKDRNIAFIRLNNSNNYAILFNRR